ncbi:MAB_1171c family putative transporter [Amycolatopsis sp. NPDC058986]|uniref:MAB_1171c family putative transporter n=1 Tax=unclassified Amycolatopsis TaxID=2618356 RepID=UPI00366E6C51
MSFDPLRLVLLIACWTVILVRLPALRSAEQRLIWFILLLLGGGMLMLQNPVGKALEHVGIPNLESLLSSLMAIGVATLLLSLALHVAGRDESRRPSWRRPRLLWCWATIAIMISAFAAVDVLKIPTRTRFLPVPGAFTAHTAYWITYLLYMVVITAWTGVVLLRHLKSTRSAVLRLAVFLLAVAMAAFLIFLATRVASLFSATALLPTAGKYVSSLHTIGILAGCSLAALLPLWHAIVNLWHGQKLYPLWKALCEAIPHVALQPPRGRLTDLLRFTDTRLRLNRMIIEIRDGLLVMREWVTPADLDAIGTALRDVPEERAEVVKTACWLKIALHARETGRPRAEEPLDLVYHGGVDIESELRWLRRIAAAWNSPTVTAYPTSAQSSTR